MPLATKKKNKNLKIIKQLPIFKPLQKLKIKHDWCFSDERERTLFHFTLQQTIYKWVASYNDPEDFKLPQKSFVLHVFMV
jgi:hypothetical protein